MGSIKKALKPITKVVDDIIPNEIKPALPYIAATFGAPYLAGKGILGALGTGALGKGVSAGLLNIGTRAALGKKFNPASALFSAATVGGGQFLRDAPMFKDSKLAGGIADLLSPEKVGGMGLGEATAAASVPLTAGTAESAYDAAKKANEEYEQYLAEQEAANNTDIQTRADYISRYMSLAGFGQDEINETLNDLGYAANGGLMGARIGYESGGSSLYDKASDMNRLAMEIKLIDLGYGGFGGKDLEGMSDEQIMKLYKEATSKANGGLMGTRVGYKIGGSTMQNVMARLLNIEVPAERLEEMRQNRADFLFNENVDAEDYPSQDYLNKVREAAEKQATKELEEYMKKIGMDPLNPPEGSMSDKLIDQIMEPRKEGRVKEDGENQTPGQEVLKQLKDFDVLPPMDDMGYMDETMQRLLKSRSGKAKGGRIEYAEGGSSSSTEQQKRENYFDLKRDEFMSLSEYLLSPMSDADLRSGKADGGIMNLKMGGMPAEMDLRGGGFVPIGAKEKADDVPARLSKNEFVMTADAVRAAGGGSVNKGAKRMYDLMHKLEARV